MFGKFTLCIRETEPLAHTASPSGLRLDIRHPPHKQTLGGRNEHAPPNEAYTDGMNRLYPMGACWLITAHAPEPPTAPKMHASALSRHFRIRAKPRGKGKEHFLTSADQVQERRGVTRPPSLCCGMRSRLDKCAASFPSHGGRGKERAATSRQNLTPSFLVVFATSNGLHFSLLCV